MKLKRLHTIRLFRSNGCTDYRCSAATTNVTKLSPLPNVLPKMLTDFILFWLFIPYVLCKCVHVFGGGHFASSFSVHQLLLLFCSHYISGVASNGGVMRLHICIVRVLLLLFSFACDIVVFVFGLFAILLQPLAQMQHLILGMSKWTNKREKKPKEQKKNNRSPELIWVGLLLTYAFASLISCAPSPPNLIRIWRSKCAYKMANEFNANINTIR